MYDNDDDDDGEEEEEVKESLERCRELEKIRWGRRLVDMLVVMIMTP